MSKTKIKFWNLLRWIFFIPFSGFMYNLSKDLITLTFSFISINFVEEMNSAPDFSEYYLLGPIFVFIMESFSVGFGVYSGVYLAPKYKKIVFIGFVCLWVLYVSFLSYDSFDLWLIPNTDEIKGFLLRMLTVFIAASSGLVIAGIFIWKEQKQIKEQKK